MKLTDYLQAIYVIAICQLRYQMNHISGILISISQSHIQPVNSLLVSYCTEDGTCFPRHVYFQKIGRFPEVFNNVREVINH